MTILKSRLFCFTFLLVPLAAWCQENQHVNNIVRILDEKARPTAARVRVTQNDSVYFAPEGHTTDFPFTNHGGDVILDNNRRFAYVSGSFSISLPVGATVPIEVVKGFAYKIHERTLNVPLQGTLSIFN
jgi:hypothetical protein